MKLRSLVVLLTIFHCTSFAQVDTCHNRITSLTNNDEDSWLMKAANGKYYVAYFSDSTGLPAIWLTRSSNGGLTWDSTWIAIQSPDSNYYPCLAQASNGIFHLTWFRIHGPSVDMWYSRSSDLITWSNPINITNNSAVDWLGNLCIDHHNNLWMTFASDRTGNFDLFNIRSTDGGNTWSAPIQLTTHLFHDNLPMMFQKADSTFILVWQRYNDTPFNYLSNTSEIWYKTSADGITWSGEDSITWDVNPLHSDILPSIYQDPRDSEIYFTWTTDRFSPQGNNVELSLSAISAGALGDQAHLITCPGYSARVIPTDTLGQFILTWVADPDNNGQHDIYSRYLNKNLALGIQAPVEKGGFNVFPNPFRSKISFQNSSGNENYELTDCLGEIIFSGKHIEQQDLSALTNGIYFLKVMMERSIQTFELIKQ